MGHECIYSAASLWQMLHDMQSGRDYRFYVVLEWIDSRHMTRTMEYPHHRSIDTIAGYIPEVCDPRVNDNCYLADWQVNYVGELWVQPTDGVMYQVRGWSDKAAASVQRFIKERGLQWEEA